MRDWIADHDRRIEQRRRVQVEDEQLQRVAMGMPHFKGCRPIGNRKGEEKQVRDLKTKTDKKYYPASRSRSRGQSHHIGLVKGCAELSKY